ncbi:MAG TPA: TolC family protein [Bacteroidales bacterium]|nr:TolC family protein [Bacteroidales bacterium]HPS18491.1 TolC family protein [Bacteroidales bacterium]
MKTQIITIIALSIVIPLQAQYSLDSCRKMALINNAKIKNAGLELEAAIQTKKAAYTKYFPTITAMGSAFKSNSSLFDMNANDVDIDVTFENQSINDIIQTLYSNYGAYIPDATINMQMIKDGMLGGVTALQPIYAGGRIAKGNQLAKLGMEAAQYKCNLAEDSVVLQTEVSYWLVVSLKEKLKTIATAEKLLDTLYKDVNGAYQSGVVLQNDLLKIMLKQNELRSKRLKAEDGIALATMSLCQYTGIPYDEKLQLTDSIIFGDTVAAPYQYRAAHNQALANRDEYKLLNLKVQSEQIKKQMLVGETMPQVAIGAGYLYNNLMEKNNTNGIIFSTVTIPVSGWWEASHNIKKQKIQQQIAENNRKDINEKLLLQMQKAWNECEQSYNQIILSEQAMKVASQNLKVATDYYRAGMSTLSEVLESESLLRQCRNEYTEQFIEYKIYLTSYLQMVNNK